MRFTRKACVALIAANLLLVPAAYAGIFQSCHKPAPGDHACGNPAGSCNQNINTGGCKFHFELYCTENYPGTVTAVTIGTGGFCAGFMGAPTCQGYTGTATFTIPDRC